MEVIDRGVHVAGGELDLVGRVSIGDVPHVLFIEIRSRTGISRGHPLETVGPRKRGHLIRASTGWLVANGLWERVAVRFDVVAVVLEPGRVAEGRSLALRDDEVTWVCAAFEVDA